MPKGILQPHFQLPKVPEVTETETREWMMGITRVLLTLIGELSRNVVLVDKYTLATLPDATARNTRDIVFVSDEVVGQQFKASDGTAWRNLG